GNDGGDRCRITDQLVEVVKMPRYLSIPAMPPVIMHDNHAVVHAKPGIQFIISLHMLRQAVHDLDGTDGVTGFENLDPYAPALIFNILLADLHACIPLFHYSVEHPLDFISGHVNDNRSAVRTGIRRIAPAEFFKQCCHVFFIQIVVRFYRLFTAHHDRHFLTVFTHTEVVLLRHEMDQLFNVGFRIPFITPGRMPGYRILLHATLFNFKTELLQVFQFLVYGYYIIQREFKGVRDEERDAGIFIHIDMIIVEFIFYTFLRSMLVHHIHPRLTLEDDV